MVRTSGAGTPAQAPELGRFAEPRRGRDRWHRGSGPPSRPEVGVGVEGLGDAGVAEPGLHDGDGFAVTDEEAGVVVAQRMETGTRRQSPRSTAARRISLNRLRLIGAPTSVVNRRRCRSRALSPTSARRRTTRTTAAVTPTAATGSAGAGNTTTASRRPSPRPTAGRSGSMSWVIVVGSERRLAIATMAAVTRIAPSAGAVFSRLHDVPAPTWVFGFHGDKERRRGPWRVGRVYESGGVGGC